MGVPISDGPTYKELENVMACCKTFSPEERMMVGRLCLLSVGIYGIHHASRVPLSSAKRVLDPDAFEKYPWGRVAFSSLVNSIKAVEYINDSYVIHGCVHALLIWVYESVPGLGESFGKRRSTLSGYPLLDWESSRKRITFEDFIKKEKTAYEKVRVRHMVDVSEENMYPNWSDADEEKDTELDNLIKDIIHKRLPANAWEGVDAVCLKKNKRKVEEKVHRQIGRIQKQEKMKEDDYTVEEEEKISSKKYKMGKEHSEDVEAEKMSLLNIWKMLETMNGTISELDNNLRSRMDILETKFESLVTEKAAFLDVQLRERIDLLEKNLKDMKEPKPGVVPCDDTNSNVKEDDEADSKNPSWMVEYKQTSDGEGQVPRVVRRVYTVKNKKKEGEVSTDLPLIDMKNVPNVHKDKVVSNKSKNECAKDGKKKVVVKQEKIDSPRPKKKKIRTDLNVDDVEDITDQVAAENYKMASSSEEAWPDARAQMAATAIGATLTYVHAGLQKLDGRQDQARRVPQLAESQKFPYVGNSTVKRIITDVVHYSETSEHLKPVEDEKLQRLMDFIKFDRGGLLDIRNTDKTFYWEIITPREDWPKDDYGWLRSYHMGAVMAMFRKRLMRDPSPYPNQRITFLDQNMIREMEKDYPQFSYSHKNFLFRDQYVNWCNGTTPIDSPTNKKWYIDIDHLYACHFVNGNHWVALDISLPDNKIYIYDSIPTMMKDKDIVEACLPLRKMIPALLSVVVPETVRKKSSKMLEVKRVRKDVPLNQFPGDCGVFALKYIECLALGKTFEGICDNNMKALRIKLGAELFDEVRESNAPETSDTVSATFSYDKRLPFLVPHLTDSP